MITNRPQGILPQGFVLVDDSERVMFESLREILAESPRGVKRCGVGEEPGRARRAADGEDADLPGSGEVDAGGGQRGVDAVVVCLVHGQHVRQLDVERGDQRRVPLLDHEHQLHAWRRVLYYETVGGWETAICPQHSVRDLFNVLTQEAFSKSRVG